MKKRIISVLLCVMMLISLGPPAAFATTAPDVGTEASSTDTGAVGASAGTEGTEQNVATQPQEGNEAQDQTDTQETTQDQKATQPSENADDPDATQPQENGRTPETTQNQEATQPSENADDPDATQPQENGRTPENAQSQDATQPQAAESEGKDESSAESDNDNDDPEAPAAEPVFNDEKEILVSNGVVVIAPVGSIPQGTTMTATPIVDTSSIVAAVEEKLADNEYVMQVIAYDITLYDANGSEIQPRIPVQVIFSRAGAMSDAEVFHMDDENSPAEHIGSGSTVTAVHFSIYVVVDPANYRRTYVFHDQNGDVISTQIVRPGIDELFEPGVTGLAANEEFRGWAETSTATTGKTINVLNEELAGTTLTGEDTINLCPAIAEVVRVYYLDESGASINAVSYDMTGGSATFTVEQDYIPETPAGATYTTQFVGWKVQGGDGTVYPNSTSYTATADVTFEAKVNRGYVLTFVENDDTYDDQGNQTVSGGASYIPPRVVPDGENASAYLPTASEMTRPGYTLSGWALQEDGSQPYYTGNAPLTQNTTVYAQWTPASDVSFQVVIWYQNVAGDGYDYHDGKRFTNGVTGTTVNDSFVQARLNSFSPAYPFGANGYIRSSDGVHLAFQYSSFDVTNGEGGENKIGARGTTVINVYYNRVQLTVRFHDTNQTNSYIEKTGLYGAPIEWVEPSTGGNYNRWNFTRNPSNTQQYAGPQFLIVFSFDNLNTRYLSDDATVMNLYPINDSRMMPFYYYKQEEDGNYPTTAWKVGFAIKETSSWTTKITPNADRCGEGFYPAEYRLSTDGVWGEWQTYTAGSQIVYKKNNDAIAVRYARRSFDVIFIDSDGSTQLPDSFSIIPFDQSVTITENNSPTASNVEDHHIFGWYQDQDLTVPFEFGTFSMPAHDVILYAKVQPNRYRIELLPGFDNAPSSWFGDTYFKVDIGEKIEGTPNRDGYVFAGWYDSDGNYFPASTQFHDSTPGIDLTYRESDANIRGKLTLTAHWRRALGADSRITVHYDPGEGTTTIADRTYLDQAQAIAAEAPEAPQGKKFLYWTYGDDKTVPGGGRFTIDANDAVVAQEGDVTTYTITLTAVYEDLGTLQYTTIYFNGNGGTINGSATTNSGSVPVNSTVNVPAADTVTRDYYAFNGWNTMADGSGVSFDTDTVTVAANNLSVEGNTDANTLYAQWEPFTFTVRFHANADDAEGRMTNQTFSYGTTQALTANGFTLANNEFIGWSTTAGIADVVYDDEESINSEIAAAILDEIGNEGFIDLYAQWQKTEFSITYTNVGEDDSFTVTWGENSAETNPNHETYTASDLPIELVNPQRDGYVFTGWTGSNGDEPQVEVTIPAGTAENLTYTANWRQTTATITVEVEVTGDYADLTRAFGGTPVAVNIEDEDVPLAAYSLTNGQHVTYTVTSGKSFQLKDMDLIKSFYTLKAKISIDGEAQTELTVDTTGDVGFTNAIKLAANADQNIVIYLTYTAREVPTVGVDLGNLTPVVLMMTLSAVLFLGVVLIKRRRLGYEA